MSRAWQDPGPQGPMPQMALPRMTRITKYLLIANSAIFLFCFVLYLSAENAYALLRDHLALNVGGWRESFPLVPVWQLLTYGFLHSVTDPTHIFWNMLMLYFFGTMLEEILGARRFLIAYLSAQLVGALFFLVAGWLSAAQGVALGASGACLGVMVAAATLRPRLTVFLLVFPITLQWLALGILGVTLFSALLSLKQGSDGVAHLIHLGGIAYGYLAVRSGLIALDPVEAIERKRAVAKVEQKASDEVRMDQLLDKIHRQGMGALTKSEREFLKRVSARK